MTFSLKNDMNIPNPDPCHRSGRLKKRPVLRFRNTSTGIAILSSGRRASRLSKPSVRMLVQKYLFCCFFYYRYSSVLKIIVLTWLNPDSKNSCTCASNGYTIAYVVSVPASAVVIEHFQQCCGSMTFWWPLTGYFLSLRQPSSSILWLWNLLNICLLM